MASVLLAPFYYMDIDDNLKIPYNNMFADDIIWLPEVLKGNKIQGECIFDREFNMLSHTIKPVDELKI